MALNDLTRFQLKRVNPFQGLVIDAEAWRDAHNYHREQLRLHTLAFHNTGIVYGLGLSASIPPDSSMTIQPGMGVDPEGNVIVIPQLLRYKMQTQKSGLVYLVAEFREVPGEPYQPPDGGQPTRMLDAYRIQERDKLPAEPYLELGRIDFDPSGGPIRDASSASSPGKNQIDLRFRKMSTAAAIDRIVQVPAPVERSRLEPQTVVIGHVVMGDAPADLHLAGIRNLCRHLSRDNGVVASVDGNISLSRDLTTYSLLYITGSGRFELNPDQEETVGTFLRSGGAIVGEGCSESSETASKGSKEFGLAFNQLASRLKHKLEIVKRGHAILSSWHVFSEVPQGAESGMLLEGGRMVYSGSDYGCAWLGGRSSQPLSREIIRAAFEFGANMFSYVRMTK